MTKKLVKEVFSYDVASGILSWRYNKKHRESKAGDEVGCSDDKGYRVVHYEGKIYKVHRLIYLYVYGYMPEIVDHKNRVKNDNTISNLREVTSSQNSCNRSLSSRNTSGVTGVSLNPRKSGEWVARISVDGKRKHLGYYDEFDDAVKARLNAELALWM